MFSIRQESLSSLEEILEMSPEKSYPLLCDPLDITPLLRVVSKKALLATPIRLNYSAMIYSLFIRVIERIPTIKDLRRRLIRYVLVRNLAEARRDAHLGVIQLDVIQLDVKSIWRNLKQSLLSLKN